MDELLSNINYMCCHSLVIFTAGAWPLLSGCSAHFQYCGASVPFVVLAFLTAGMAFVGCRRTRIHKHQWAESEMFVHWYLGEEYT
jgi:hypothetical protein